jgi:hypothetical protein
VVVVVVSVVAVVSLVCEELTIGSGVVVNVVVVVVSAVVAGVSVTLTDDVDPAGRLFTLVFVPTVEALPLPGALLLV